jgi:hypothetical protein
MRLNAARQLHHTQPLPTGRYVDRSSTNRPIGLEAFVTEHAPVLLDELVSLLAPEPGQTAVDCTFGGGGHARRVAAQLGSSPQRPVLPPSLPKHPAGLSLSLQTSQKGWRPSVAKGCTQT